MERAAIDEGQLVVAVQDAVREEFGRLSCINAVAALVDVGRIIGKIVEPLVARAFVYNRALTKMVGDFQAPEADELVRRWSNDRRCLQVHLGMGAPRPSDWKGHMVGVIRIASSEDAHVLDATLEQANLPEEGIVLDTVVLTV